MSSELYPRPDYPMPGSQLDDELGFRDSFAQSFPNEQGLLNALLSQIQVISGMDIPTYQSVDGRRKLLEVMGLTDEFGFSRLKPDFSAVTLHWAPNNHGSNEGITTIRSALPDSTSAMLVGAYSLIGARIVAVSGWRKDAGVELCDIKRYGYQREIARMGSYHGSTVYVGERYQFFGHGLSKLTGIRGHTFGVTLYNEPTGQKYVQQLHDKMSSSLLDD